MRKMRKGDTAHISVVNIIIENVMSLVRLSLRDEDDLVLSYQAEVFHQRCQLTKCSDG